MTMEKRHHLTTAADPQVPIIDYVENYISVHQQTERDILKAARKIRNADVESRTRATMMAGAPEMAKSIANEVGLNKKQTDVLLAEARRYINSLGRLRSVTGEDIFTGLDMGDKQLLREDLWHKMEEELEAFEGIFRMCDKIFKERRTHEYTIGEDSAELLKKYRDKLLDVLAHEGYIEWVYGEGIKDREVERSRTKLKKAVAVGVPMVGGAVAVGLGLGGMMKMLDAGMAAFLTVTIGEMVTAGLALSGQLGYRCEKYTRHMAHQALDSESNVTDYVLGLEVKLSIVDQMLALWEKGIEDPKKLVRLAEQVILQTRHNDAMRMRSTFYY